MKSVNVVMAAALLVLVAWMPAAAVKYVAVVETDVDAASGASADINPAEVREITAEFRRQATELLPSDRYSVMTSETIQSMGGAVLEECSEENCVIALGSKIGADYIVRGTISKFQTRFTLAVEMYETENGTLVVSSEAVRSENLGELLDKGAVACANMYKKFVDKQKPAAAAVADDAGQQAGKKGKAKKEKPAAKEKTMASAGGEQGEGSEWKEVYGKEIVQRGDFALKYMFPVKTPFSRWGVVAMEMEVVRSSWRVIWGGEILFGADRGELLVGVGHKVHKGYNWGNQMQLLYGGYIGEWIVSRKPLDLSDEYNAYALLGPHVKYRWRFLEVSASWYFGVHGRSFKEEYYDDLWEESRYQKKSETKFYHTPQIMAGLYIKGPTYATRKKIKD